MKVTGKDAAMTHGRVTRGFMPVYRCPVCTMEPRVTDHTKKEGDNIVRTIIYECGTVLKIVQSNFRFKKVITKSEKCIETISVAV